MKRILMLLALTGQILVSCNTSSNKQPIEEKINSKSAPPINGDSIAYKTENLIIKGLSSHCYVHTSFLNTNDFGRVDCNGMIVVNENEAVVFDTPTGSESSKELISFVTQKLKSKIIAIIPTHFHEDCVGGLEIFNNYNIPVYASNKTIELLRNKGNTCAKLIKGFGDSLTLNVGGDVKVYAKYFGEGHTSDNVIGYVPKDGAIFGGCLIKAVGAGKGNLGDANVDAWPETVRKLRHKYSEAKIVIPGHGKIGNKGLLDYTINLFK